MEKPYSQQSSQEAYSQVKKTSSEAIPRSLEEIKLTLLKNRFIVNDGYDYLASEPAPELPTTFHGTSAWLEEEILQAGLKVEIVTQEDLERILTQSSWLRIDYNLKKKESQQKQHVGGYSLHQPRTDYMQRLRKRHIYTSLNHSSASRYASVGPEVINDWLDHVRPGVTDGKNVYREMYIESLGSIDTREKKILMASLDPKPMVLHIKSTLEELDIERTGSYSPETAFLWDSQARKELIENIQRAREIYLQHRQGKVFTLQELFPVEMYIRHTIGEIISDEELGILPLEVLVEVYLRTHAFELLSNNINSNSVVEVEKL